jgi:two-component system chemotaxis response regulator CheB
MKKTRVLIVDDSALIRQLFEEMLASDPEIEVIGTATDPLMAREKIKELNPDVITLDIEMPKMDGISFLEKIMTLRPMPVVMVSTLTQRGADETIRAMELGAVDYISKPVDGGNSNTLKALQSQLIDKVKAAARVKIDAAAVKQRIAHSNEKEAILPYTPSKASLRKLIAIGSSTGGVEALRELLTVLPATTPPIVITQHMPPLFTASFAARLNGLCELTIHEAQEGMKIERGHAYIAPGDFHMAIKKQGSHYVIRVYKGENVSGHCPSVDVLFQSVAKESGKDTVAAILTGMGKDGAEGMLQLLKKGAYTIGQDEASCVVYGMPKAARALGALKKELPLSKIAAELLLRCNED